jgi:hypothetical protein
VWPFNNITTTPQQIMDISPPRASISFINPGVETVFIASTIDSQGRPLIPSLTALGGCIPILPGGFIQLVGEVQNAWQAFAATDDPNPLTVIESNV